MFINKLLKAENKSKMIMKNTFYQPALILITVVKISKPTQRMTQSIQNPQTAAVVTNREKLNAD